MDQKDRIALDDLKSQIEESMYALELLQRKHRSLTGVPHVMPFYLTDPRNRKTLKRTQNMPGEKALRDCKIR